MAGKRRARREYEWAGVISLAKIVGVLAAAGLLALGVYALLLFLAVRVI